MKKQIKLSLIIPIYNEQELIEKTLQKILTFLKKKKYSWEIIVVDDGSSDDSADKVKKFGYNLDFVKLNKNMGKGAALRAGVERAKGQFIIFSDADLSVPIENIDKFMKELAKNDLTIGSRRVEGSEITIHQPVVRESMGRVYTTLSRLITGTNLADFTCGFKGFKNKCAKKIFGRMTINRWAYDSEILFLANKYGYRIKEIPVTWRNRGESRVRLGIDTMTSFRDLLMVRINDILGKYD